MKKIIGWVNYKGEPSDPPKKGQENTLYLRKKYVYLNGQKIDMSYYVKSAYPVYD